MQASLTAKPPGPLPPAGQRPSPVNEPMRGSQFSAGLTHRTPIVFRHAVRTSTGHHSLAGFLLSVWHSKMIPALDDGLLMLARSGAFESIKSRLSKTVERLSASP